MVVVVVSERELKFRSLEGKEEECKDGVHVYMRKGEVIGKK